MEVNTASDKIATKPTSFIPPSGEFQPGKGVVEMISNRKRGIKIVLFLGKLGKGTVDLLLNELL
jgi:hypothetical protein